MYCDLKTLSQTGFESAKILRDTLGPYEVHDKHNNHHHRNAWKIRDAGDSKSSIWMSLSLHIRS